MQISSSPPNPLLTLLGAVQGASSASGGPAQQPASAADSGSALASAAPMSSGGTALSSTLLAILQNADGGNVPAAAAADPASSLQFVDNMGVYNDYVPSYSGMAHTPGKDLSPSQVSTIENQLGVKAVYNLNGYGQVDPVPGIGLYDAKTGKPLDASDPRIQEFSTMADKIGTWDQADGAFGSNGSNAWNTVLATLAADPITPYSSSGVAAAKQWLADQQQGQPASATTTSTTL